MDETFPEMFRQRAMRDPGRRALTFDGETLTFAETRERFESLATALDELGVRRGDRVVYAGLNHPNLVFTMFATMDLGAVFSAIDPRLAGPERAWILEDLRPAVVVVDQSLLDGYREISGHTVVSAEDEGDLSVAGLIAAHEPAPRLPVSRSDLAMVLYTSGTTGFPKGVMYTHEMILANGLNTSRMLGTNRTDVALIHTPMFHTTGLNTGFVNVWPFGGEVVLLPRMNAPAVLDAIVRYGVTRMDTVTAALNVLYHTPSFHEADLSSIRSLNCGGAPIPAEQVAVFGRHGATIHMAMGMTECTVAFGLAPEKLAAKPTSVGTPLASVRARLVDEAGAVVSGPDINGELCLKGPSVTPGYWNNPAATEAAFDEAGWFHTGDLARYDEDGDLYLVGRLKDVIKTGGETVAAAEVERVIAQHEAVHTAAAIAAPDERWGETVMAVVQLVPGHTLELEALRRFCEPHLARFKLPTRLLVVDDLPLTASGKVQKHKLRERLQSHV